LLAYRELDEALGLTDVGEELLSDWHTGKNTQHSMVALIRQSISSRLAGYEDTNDVEWHSVDPTMRQVVGGASHGTHGSVRRPDGTLRDRGVDTTGQPEGVDEAVREMD